jgi:hypothetical protein
LARAKKNVANNTLPAITAGVAIGDRAEDQLTDARPVEHDLDDEGPADEGAEVDADKGYDRDHGVPEAVDPDDAAFARPFGTSGADEVGP